MALSAFLGTRGPGLAIGELLKIAVFAPDDLAFRLDAWLRVGSASANAALPTLAVPMLAVVGEIDRLLPSVDEARRLQSVLTRGGGEPSLWRGTVIVPGAGHASTLGNRLDLLAEIRSAFAAELPLRPARDAPQMPPGDAGVGWDRGMLDRSFPPLDPADYTRWNGGDLTPLTPTS